MPLPDADKRSPRVYTLLQNLDLENITADTLADVADPIAIEEQNEDELRRLCLIAFARMVTKGSFDGWLSGGGGGMDQVGVLENATYKYFSITQAAPWGSLGPSTGTDVQAIDTPAYVPFICPNDGDVAGLTVNLTSAGSANLYAGIYSSTDGLPDSLLGYATMDMNVSTGNVRQTSFSSTITLVRGTTYWLGWVRSTYTSFTLSSINISTQAALGPTGDVENGYSMVMIETGTTHTLPATVTPANLQVTSEARIMCNLDW
ncbi:MAG TPA: hypothetical protein EYO33_31750 [Phycisphaerales bacterium]|nr:hypothetical protein [Phycisphaerales bacterium]